VVGDAYDESDGVFSIEDQDFDGDGTPDCLDSCPDDPNKIDPGICGCRVPDTDSDVDGVADCNDGCPKDPNKTAPGVCGCGIADTDSDDDGELDCKDSDDDNDELNDDEEQGPGGDDKDYDGNDDGIADSLQDNVASFHTYDDQSYVTMESPVGTSISSCKAVDNPSPTNSPSSNEFSYGFFEFKITGVGNGDVTTVILHFPVGATFDTYYKYGPTPSNDIDHWYEFLNDGQTGAEINGNVITLHFVDGKKR